jgi:hypothetical protein
MKRLAVLFLLLACFALGLFAQTSSITGTVSDPTGAVIPGATITIVNLATGAERSATADDQGRYTMQQLTPGAYKLTAKATGFGDVVLEKVELLVNQPATLDLKFDKVGSTSTTVEVAAAAVQVNTTDASLGNAIDNNVIVSMPLFARNVAGLLAFQPGVTSFGSGNTPTTTSGTRDGAVNGGKPDQGNITLDGADVNDQNARLAFTTVLRVTLDSVEEFRTVTTNGDAATGRGSGADITLVTKSGTNQFHGTLYEYRRGTETAANTFFNNRSIDASGKGVPIAPLLINVYGGSGGGAIKKNKLFYFLNYEARRDASSAAATRTVPTDSMKQGIIKYPSAAGAVVGGVLVPTGTILQADPTTLKQIDPLGIGISNAALTALKAFPSGNNNAVGDSLNFTGYSFNAPTHNVQNTYISKFDWKPDSAGKHALFLRGNLQNDSSNGTPQFPGLASNTVVLANNKGLASGWTYVITPNLVSTVHYGFTRAGGETSGILATNYEWFRGLSTPIGTNTSTARIIPVHSIGDDISWIHGAHDFRFGGIFRSINNISTSNSNSFSVASSNPSWLTGSGSNLTPTALVPVSSGAAQQTQYAIAALLGLESQGTASYNYQIDGTLITPGLPVGRNFANREGEFYFQDTWKVTRNFTVTAGIRYSLEPPVHEINGQQASTNISIAQWEGARSNFAGQGLSETNAGLIEFIPASQGNPMYPFHKNWAPRLAMAYSPKAESGIMKWLFGGPGKTSIRAGAGIYYDLVGQPLAQTFAGTTPGISQSFSNPANTLSEAQVPRYTVFGTVPSAIVPPPGKGGLPLVYPSIAGTSGSFAITNSIDDNLSSPYTMNLDLSIGRDLGHGFFVQGAYVGRLSRHSLLNRDLAEPLNMVDPKSGQSYYQAMTQLMTFLDLQGGTIANLPKIPFFENMWPAAAGNGLTATQVWGLDYHGDPTKGILKNSNVGDATNTLNNADNASNCNPGSTKFSSTGRVNAMACGIQGPFMMFTPQFSALSTWSSIGLGDYHGMQWTVRKRFSSGLQFDFNYTWSKSIDLGSAQENAGSFTGFVINTANPSQMRAVSNFDTTHQVNAFGIYQLPFGRGAHFGANMNKAMDAIVGGWQISATYRATSGLPFNANNGQRWPTNWNLGGNATPNGNPLPPVTNTGNAVCVSGLTCITGPAVWDTPSLAFSGFREDFPGESGGRNNLRGAGLFNIDMGIGKTFTMPYSEHHKLQIRGEAFNLTNSVIFDTANATLSDFASTSFGKISGTLTNPRQMQFLGRYTW